MRAIIAANGHLQAGEEYGHLVADGDLVIGVDGGAAIALQAGLQPDVVIGDMDSIPENVRAVLQAHGCRFLEYPTRKNETDTELAVHYALQAGAREIVFIGATGKRLDHTLANLFLLAMPELQGLTCRIVAGDTDAWLVRDRLEIAGQPGDIVSLLPLSQDVTGLRTQGLEYALHGDTLRFGATRGVSNVMTASRASIRLREGALLVLRVAQERARSE